MFANFIQRAITGILFVVIMGAALIFGPITYAILMTTIIVLSTLEFCKILCVSGYQPHTHLAIVVNVLAFVMGFFICYSGVDSRILLSLVGLIWVIFLFELFGKNQSPALVIANTLICIIYVGMPFALFNLLVFKGDTYDFWPIICLFSLAWINDTGAYLCGITMGRHKLYERISPKKTIEGFVGGVVFTVVGSWLIHYLSGTELWFCILCGLIVSILGTCGDLIESMFKRSVNIKDSGNVLPGHGGILDRFDAIMFSAPLVSLLYYFFI